MAFVLVCAVGLAALRNANELWARVMMMVAVALVGVAVLWAILLRGRERAWWLGFAVLGATYLFARKKPTAPASPRLPRIRGHLGSRQSCVHSLHLGLGSHSLPGRGDESEEYHGSEDEAGSQGQRLPPPV